MGLALCRQTAYLMYRLNYILISALLTFSVSCNPDRVQYNEQLKQQMADMRIKRVTNADLSEAVDSWGAQIVTIAERESAEKWKDIRNKEVTRESLCNLSTLPKTQALAKRYGMTISLLSAADVKNPKLAKKEQEVLDAYLYNAEQKLPQSSNIQPIGDSLFVYNAALSPGHIFNQCVGGQTPALAVWRLAFPKREVIRHLNAKK